MFESAWFLLLAIALTFVALSWWVNRSKRAGQKSLISFSPDRLHERIAVGRQFYLQALQRELANVILSQKLEAFEKAFYRMRDWEAEIDNADKSRRDAEYNLLLEKFPNLEDFDLIGTKHFIQYEDTFGWDIDDAVECYKEISKFLILDPKRSAGYPTHSFKREAEIFRENVRKYKDRRLKQAMEEAMGRYHAWRQDRDNSETEFKDRDYEVILLIGHPSREFTPEIEYGIVCKMLGEFGIYSFFVDDDRDKTYYSYHRSDSTFSRTDVLMH